MRCADLRSTLADSVAEPARILSSFNSPWSVTPIWAAEGPATLDLTLNPVVEDEGGEAVVQSVMLIVDLTPPITLRTAAAITQTLRCDAGRQWVTAAGCPGLRPFLRRHQFSPSGLRLAAANA